MYDDVIKLISETREQDSAGVFRSETEYRQVFCQVESVTRSEFYSAGRAGLNPEFKITVFSGDYRGEELVEYNGKSYSIYRTYRVPGTDYMELYLERKGGSNGKWYTSGETDSGSSGDPEGLPGGTAGGSGDSDPEGGTEGESDP